MKKTSISIVLAALLASGVNAFSQEVPQVFKEAVTLFQNGAYDQARSLFDKCDEPLSRAWSVLCAVKGRAPSYRVLIEDLERESPRSALYNPIHFAAAMNLFDEGDYAAAGDELRKVDEKLLPAGETGEYVFKKAYCHYAQENYPPAMILFRRVVDMPYSVYTAPSQYALGYIAYNNGGFPEAEKWFGKAAADPRFEELSNYYIMECRFLDKDYDYVAANGPTMLETLPAERRGRLARMISESYLVKGNDKKALEYLKLEESAPGNRNRADYFHAGSVHYAVGDYAGAIDNFTKMGALRDSIGQVAAYDLGYSYIRTGNKVSAAGAFGDAASMPFDPAIREDAAFNAAKLAFDLNGDTSPFKEYLAKYPSEKRAPQIYNYMARAALNNRDYAGAIDNYSKIEELNEVQQGNYIKANYLRASQLIESGNWSDAVPFLRAAGFHYPKTDRFNQLSRYWLAEANFNAGNYAEAETTWTDLYNNSALRGMKENRLLTYDLGYACFNQKRYEAAARWFDLYAASNDKTSREDALTRRADCDFARHDYRSAVNSYGKVLNEYRSPDKIYPYLQQAIAYGLAGDKDSKIKVLSTVRQASASAPLYSEAMYELGRAYMETEKYNSAVDVFEKLRRSTADNTFMARALIGKGMAYRNMKDYDTALGEYKKVVTLMPGSQYSQDALLAINSIYQALGQPEKYIEYLENSGVGVGRNASEKEDIYFNTAEQVYLAGNYAQALKSLQKYLDDYPAGAKRGDALFYLADSYRRLGQKERACESFLAACSALKEGPFAESSALGYATLSYELERFADAYNGYETLLGIAQMPENKSAALLGRVRSAYAGKMWSAVVSSAEALKAAGATGATLREANFDEARALLAQSRRDEAFELFQAVAKEPSTREGAESTYMIVQDLFDSGKYDRVESRVYDFAEKGGQGYWLARCYIVLAESFAARGNTAQARATLESIRDGYSPSSSSDDIQKLVAEKLAKL